MFACIALALLMVVKNRRLPSVSELSNFIFGGGENLVPLILIAGAAGVVIGVLNATGLAFQLALLLTALGKSMGIFVMLILTAFIAIILGMGMPTAAVYIVLVTVVAPALIDMNIVPMAAHLFLFYFGLLSMLTPPVAVASMVAAGLAGSDMWRTGLVGVQLAAIAYLLPFLWVFNPALILIGNPLAIALAVSSAVIGGWMLARALQDFSATTALGLIWALVLLVGAIFIGGSTIWLGSESLLVVVVSAVGLACLLYLRRRDKQSELETA